MGDTHSKCTTFHTKYHFSCPGGIVFLSPVPGTNELFLLHFPMVLLAITFSTLPAWLQLSFTCLRRPGNGHLQELHSCNVPSSRFYTAAIKKIYIIKLVNQIIYAAILSKIHSLHETESIFAL